MVALPQQEVLVCATPDSSGDEVVGAGGDINQALDAFLTGMGVYFGHFQRDAQCPLLTTPYGTKFQRTLQ